MSETDWAYMHSIVECSPAPSRRRSRYLPHSSCRPRSAHSSQAGTSSPLGSAFPLFLFSRGERHESICLVPRRSGQRITLAPGLRVGCQAVARELLLRDLRAQMRRGPLMTSPQVLRDWLRLYCAGLEHEVFLALYLDAQHRLIEVEELFRGT